MDAVLLYRIAGVPSVAAPLLDGVDSSTLPLADAKRAPEEKEKEEVTQRMLLISSNIIAGVLPLDAAEVEARRRWGGLDPSSSSAAGMKRTRKKLRKKLQKSSSRGARGHSYTLLVRGSLLCGVLVSPEKYRLLDFWDGYSCVSLRRHFGMCQTLYAKVEASLCLCASNSSFFLRPHKLWLHWRGYGHCFRVCRESGNCARCSHLNNWISFIPSFLAVSMSWCCLRSIGNWIRLGKDFQHISTCPLVSGSHLFGVCVSLEEHLCWIQLGDGFRTCFRNSLPRSFDSGNTYTCQSSGGCLNEFPLFLHEGGLQYRRSPGDDTRSLNSRANPDSAALSGLLTWAFVSLSEQQLVYTTPQCTCTLENMRPYPCDGGQCGSCWFPLEGA